MGPLRNAVFLGHGISSDLRDFWPQETALSIQKTYVPLKPISDCFSVGLLRKSQAIAPPWWPCLGQTLSSSRVWPAPHWGCAALSSLSVWHSSRHCWKLHSSKEPLCCYFFPLPALPFALAFPTRSPAIPPTALGQGQAGGASSKERENAQEADWLRGVSARNILPRVHP